MRHIIDAHMASLTSLAYKAHVHHGLAHNDIVILCIDPNSEWADIITTLSLTTPPGYGFACCVTNARVIDELITELPELEISLQQDPPPNHVRLLAFGAELKTYHIEVIPSPGKLQ
jgi:hypothetical protein